MIALFIFLIIAVALSSVTYYLSNVFRARLHNLTGIDNNLEFGIAVGWASFFQGITYTLIVVWTVLAVSLIILW